MNNRIIKYGILVASLLVAACEDASVRVNIPTPPDTMELQASQTEIELQPNLKNGEAVCFTWNPAANRGGKITYCFKMDTEENAFSAASIVKYLPEGVFSCSFTYKELYDILKSWDVKAGIKQTLVAEVIARTENEDYYMKPEVSRMEISVQTYASSLFLLGPGTTIGEDLTKAMQMQEVVSGSIYAWFGWLNGGDIYFPITRQSPTPAYGRGADNWSLEYYDEGTVAPLSIPGMGYYSLRIDTESMTFDQMEEIHMIGDGSAAGWYIDRSIPFERPDRTQRRYVYKGVLNKGGEIKFPLRDGSYGWGVPYLMPLSNGTPAEGETPMDFSHTGWPDMKWVVPHTGYYTITLDTGAKTARFDCTDNLEDLPFTRVWMVGDATPGGWNSDPFRIELQYDPTATRGTFTWEGELRAGELKFPLGMSTFEVPFLMPLEVDDENHASLNESRLDYVENGTPDKKWLVKSEEAGRYRITLNVKQMIVKFEKVK